MDEEIRDLLMREIESEFQILSTFESGSKEKSTAIDDLATLYRLNIEDTKNKLDFESEERLRRNQLIEQVKDRYYKLGVEVAGIILPLIFYATWMKRGFKFEEKGTFTSTTFKGLFNRFKPTKK